MPWTSRRDAQLRERAAIVIPGGMYGHQSTALLPSGYPQFFSRASGTRIWDVDSNEYIDFMCAYGPNLLGYSHPPVEAAIRFQQALGDTMTGPSEVMVTLAERFVSLISHAEWAMFCKNGGDATSMAVVIARAYKGRRKILVAEGAYHGSDIWCTPRLTGILAEDRAHIVTYRSNDPDSLRDVFRRHRGDVAAVFATAFRHEVFQDQVEPDATFAREARQLCDEDDALLVVDDVRAGFRVARDCTWSVLGVKPDLSIWGKVIGNGQPISALLGADKAREAAKNIFVTGSFWFSAVPMAAAVATLSEIATTDYLERIVATGTMFRQGLGRQASNHGFTLRQTGPAQMPQILFEDDPDMRLGFHWTEAAMRRGVYLHPHHNMFINAALTPADVARSLEATDAAFADLKRHRDVISPMQVSAVRERLERLRGRSLEAVYRSGMSAQGDPVLSRQ